MDTLAAKLIERADQLGIDISIEFNSALLMPEARIRELCFENKCGKFKNHYMCPPYVGSMESIEAKLREFRKGILFQYEKPLDVANDATGLVRSKLEFHEIILEIEYLARESISHALGFIGGSCELCDVCKASLKEPCPHPTRARMSLESIAVDVISLLDRLGLDSEFRPDRIKWTGCILF